MEILYDIFIAPIAGVIVLLIWHWKGEKLLYWYMDKKTKDLKEIFIDPRKED